VLDEDASRPFIKRAIDLGITFFDNADSYGDGKGERMLARALGKQRDKIVIATKFGYDIYNNPDRREGQRELPQDFSTRHVRFALEQSLKRLGTDYVDIYLLHNPRLWAIESDELFDLLDAFKREGKVRHYGVALGPAIGWEAEGTAVLRDRDIDVLHHIYNLLEQDPGQGFMETAEQKGVGCLVRVPHSSGMLEGKYTADTTFDASDHRSHRPREWLINGLKKVEQLRFLHEGTDRTIGQAAVQYILDSWPCVTSVLPNIYDDAQLKEFAEAPDTPSLTADEITRVNALYASNFGLPRAQEAASTPAATARGAAR